MIFVQLYANPPALFIPTDNEKVPLIYTIYSVRDMDYTCIMFIYIYI